MSLSFKIWVALFVQSMLPLTVGMVLGLLWAYDLVHVFWLLPASAAVVAGFDAVLAEAEAGDRMAS